MSLPQPKKKKMSWKSLLFSLPFRRFIRPKKCSMTQHLASDCQTPMRKLLIHVIIIVIVSYWPVWNNKHPTVTLTPV